MNDLPQFDHVKVTLFSKTARQGMVAAHGREGNGQDRGAGAGEGGVGGTQSASAAAAVPSSSSSSAPHKPLAKGLVLHFHGGGFVSSTSRTHEIYLKQWAHELDCPIVSVDYSLAPQHPCVRLDPSVVCGRVLRICPSSNSFGQFNMLCPLHACSRVLWWEGSRVGCKGCCCCCGRLMPTRYDATQPRLCPPYLHPPLLEGLQCSGVEMHDTIRRRCPMLRCRYPRALNECFFVYTWALANAERFGWSGQRICFTGDSAGGNLAVAVALRCLQEGVHVCFLLLRLWPLCALLFSCEG
jgi:hypothetical protein